MQVCSVRQQAVHGFAVRRFTRSFFRLARLSSLGFFVHGSTSHYFYNFLDGKIPGKSAASVASKVFIDQVLWNPIFGIMFFSYVAALEGKGPEYVVNKVKKELLTSVRSK